MAARFVNVSVKSVHIDAAENQDIIESFAIGKKNYHGDKIYISYAEPDESGLTGTTTILKIAGDKLTLTRSGEIEQKLDFHAGELTRSIYQTSFGALTMDVDTKKLQITFFDEDIDIYIEYILMINGELQGLTRLCICVREDSKVGH